MLSQLVWLSQGEASTAYIKSDLQLGRVEVHGDLRNCLYMDRPEHHCVGHLKERGVEKRSDWHSNPQGREWSVFNSTNIGTVSRATLGTLLRDGLEHVWDFLSVTMPPWAETETETAMKTSKIKIHPGYITRKWAYHLIRQLSNSCNSLCYLLVSACGLNEMICVLTICSCCDIIWKAMNSVII